LNGILGMTDLLLHTNLDADQQDFAATVWQSSESLATIIDNILTFSQLQQGKLVVSSRPFDFEKLLSDAHQWTAQLAGLKGLTVELHYPSSSPREYLGDETYLRQIVRHLCDNAVKFTDRGSIRLAFESCVESQQARVKITVEDTGIGIAPRTQPALFEHFTQADGSLTRRRGGTGLGLALVKSLVESMDGEVAFESELGRGSKFSVVIPLQLPPHEPKPDSVALPGKGGVAC
jgi:signal transduction histidine kinase